MITSFRMAEALAIQKMFCDAGPLRITEQIGVLSAVGDAAGMKPFEQIAASYQEVLPKMLQ